MVRVKAGVYTRQRKKKIFRLAKGYRLGKRNKYRIVKEQMAKSLAYSYIDRKKKKRDFKSLWITRINAASRIYGMSYSRLINGLRKANIGIDRKMLADLAVNDITAFAAVAEKAKASLGLSQS